MLVGGGVLRNKEPAVSNGNGKRVSFKTEHEKEADEQREETPPRQGAGEESNNGGDDQYDSNANLNDEKMDRVREDPDVG